MKLLASFVILSANFLSAAAFSASNGWGTSTPAPSLDDDGFFEIFPTYDSMETIQSGGTVRTYKMPAWATRVQMRLETNGRPMRGEVNLWLGPLRKTHTFEIKNNENGKKFPIQTLLKFKPTPVLKISTTDLPNHPMKVGIHVPSPERAKILQENTEKVFDNAIPEVQKKLIQGANVDGKYGKIAEWTIPDDVESIQLLGWSKDSGKKSFKCNIELIQGPNNVKQDYFLQCGGGSQPYHTVYQTPGPGWKVRIQNKKFVEDGLIQIAVLPYEMGKKSDAVKWNLSA